MRCPSRPRTAALALAASLLAGALAGCSDAGSEPVALTPTTGSSTAPTSSSPSEPSAEPTSGEASPRSGAEPAPSDPGVSVGGVVAGFPLDALPVPEGAEVLLTSAVPDGDRLQVSLSGRTTQAPEAVLETYRASLTGVGFAESPSAGAPGALASTFTRGGGAELVSVVVVPDAQGGGPSTFTVGGTVAAPAP